MQKNMQKYMYHFGRPRLIQARHFTNSEWAWHTFDAVVVFFGVVERLVLGKASERGERGMCVS